MSPTGHPPNVALISPLFPLGICDPLIFEAQVLENAHFSYLWHIPATHTFLEGNPITNTTEKQIVFDKETPVMLTVTRLNDRVESTLFFDLYKSSRVIPSISLFAVDTYYYDASSNTLKLFAKMEYNDDCLFEARENWYALDWSVSVGESEIPFLERQTKELSLEVRLGESFAVRFPTPTPTCTPHTPMHAYRQNECENCTSPLLSDVASYRVFMKVLRPPVK